MKQLFAIVIGLTLSGCDALEKKSDAKGQASPADQSTKVDQDTPQDPASPSTPTATPGGESGVSSLKMEPLPSQPKANPVPKSGDLKLQTQTAACDLDVCKTVPEALDTFTSRVVDGEGACPTAEIAALDAAYRTYLSTPSDANRAAANKAYGDFAAACSGIKSGKCGCGG